MSAISFAFVVAVLEGTVLNGVVEVAVVVAAVVAAVAGLHSFTLMEMQLWHSALSR